ncbi:hypothetical protein [Serratia liquefaciens]|uniref:hypothetical protein n=1 Tax=Serratia liquefaciens TaxID=614 RepID=UPI001020FEC5|nr:hypothetical protein [Serratia liquefaciens]RYM69616.1 hypothetical protein BSQ99_17690 [Serratia liquefaciens]
MSLDSTLLGALIGVVAVIVGSIVTATATYFISKGIERKRLITEKREELFYINQNLYVIIKKLDDLLAINSNAPTTYARNSESKKDELIDKIELLTQLYFKELTHHYESAFESINETFRSVIKTHNPNIGHSKDSVERLERIKDKILTGKK